MRVAAWHNLPSGGGRRLLGDHLRHLRAAGHELAVWTTPQSARDLPELPDGIDVRVVDLQLRWDRPGGRTWSALPPAFVVGDRSRAMGRHLDAVAAHMRRWAPDVIFANACRYFRAVDLGSRVAAPSVLYLGEPYRWLYESTTASPWTPGGRSGLRRLTYPVDRRAWSRQMSAEIAAAGGYDRLLVNSLFSRESVLRAYGLDATVCYPGVDVARLAAARGGGPADPPYLLSVGALAPEKRPELVVEAVAAMAHRDVPLVWVANAADPAYAAEVRSRAAAAGVRLDLRLRVPDAELTVLLAGATALVYAPRLEPFGLAPLEAAAAGVPCVAVSEAGVRETVVDGETGLLGSTVAELAAALDRLLDEPELRSRLGRQARERAAADWDLPAAGRRLEEQLLAVAEQRTRSRA